VDAIRDAQRIAAEAGRAHPSLADMKSAVLDCRMPSDRNTAEGFSEPETRRRSRKEITEPLQPAFSEPSEALQTPDRRTNLAGDLPAENPRFNPSISGRAARDLATT